MKKEKIFLLLIVICIAVMVIYNQMESSIKIDENQSSLIRWNTLQTESLNDISEIKVGVSEELLYLLNEEGITPYQSGFLYDYLSEIFKPTGKTISIIPLYSLDSGFNEAEINDVNCIVGEVTNNLRYQADVIDFSKAIFKTKGSLFINAKLIDKENQEKKDNYIENSEGPAYKGLAYTRDLSLEKIGNIKYNDVAINFSIVNDIQAMVEEALARDVDFIAGNQQAITLALLESASEDLYINQNVVFYERNVCIFVSKEEPNFYSIVSSLLGERDTNIILTQLQGKWFGLPSPFLDRSSFTDLFLFIIIIFGAVLSVFFIYYQSNKNLYKELKTRMEELISSQNEMNTTFNGVSYFMAELDTEGIVLEINKAFLEFLDARRQETIGRPFMDIWKLSDEAIEEIKGAIERTVSNKISQNLEVIDDRLVFEIGVFPINTTKNQLEKILLIANDVTSVRAAKRQIIQDNKMIAVGQLAAGVAHEIRNPLGIIRNYCYLLKTMDPNDTEKRISALQVIEKSVETSSKIINNLLNFSRISNSDKELVWLESHLDSILFLNEQKIMENNMNVQINCKEDFQVEILKESFDMILINLISNAIDASPKGGLINISLSKKEKVFIVSVKDHGTGIPKKYIDNIYNPFFTTKTKQKGNGLGLYIVYNEVQKMNGTINLISNEGYGTEFRLEFPLKSQEGRTGI